MALFYDPAPGTTFSYLVPEVTGLNFEISMNASGTTGTDGIEQPAVAPNTSGLTLTAPSPPSPIQPIDGATGVNTTTTFSWTPIASGVYCVLFHPGALGSWDEYVFTAKTSVQLPDLSGLGLTLSSGAYYRWNTTAIAPIADQDQMASLARINAMLDMPSTTTVVATMAPRSFVTQ